MKGQYRYSVDRLPYEMATSAYRAGSDIYITYFAKSSLNSWMKEELDKKLYLNQINFYAEVE